MEYTTEARVIPVTAYRDNNGDPTCAVDFDVGDVCQFYQARRIGTDETCFFAKQFRRDSDSLTRRNNGMGTLIPLENCPLWPDK